MTAPRVPGVRRRAGLQRRPPERAAAGAAPEGQLVPYYEARAAEYDDWYLRRGRYAHGRVQDAAWVMELDAATSWLDGLPLAGEIVELAAGTGWWSALLATKGELHACDAAAAPLDLARERLVAHGLRADLQVRDAWAPPDRRVDGLFATAPDGGRRGRGAGCRRARGRGPLRAGIHSRAACRPLPVALSPPSVPGSWPSP